MQRYGIDISDPESISYVTGVVSNFTGNGVRHIAIQRWLDQVNYGFEGYSVWSRMEFPVLFLGQGVVATQVPTRYFYSSKTTDKNQANADAAINRVPLSGLNTTFQKAWWGCRIDKVK